MGNCQCKSCKQKVSFIILNDEASCPRKSSGMDSDAGFDLQTIEGYVLQPNERHLFKTGIGIQIPKGYYARVAPRSGLAHKHGVDVLAGVVDQSYRQEIGVILINHGDKPYTVTGGDRIAQLIITKILDDYEVEVLDKFTDKEGGGFGHTGV